jgi:hypothetical protein
VFSPELLGKLTHIGEIHIVEFEIMSCGDSGGRPLLSFEMEKVGFLGVVIERQFEGEQT